MSLSFVYPKALWLFILLPLMLGLPFIGSRHQSKKRFWISLVIRSILFILLIFSLAGLQVLSKSNSLTTIFLLDKSDSIPIIQQEKGESLIQTSLKEMPKGDKAAVIVFGKDALVEKLATEEISISTIESVPITTQTNISDALQLAMAIFPNEGAKRIVLISDGQENLGQAVDQAELLAASSIQLLYFPLDSNSSNTEVFIKNIDAPANIRQGETIQLKAIIHSTAQVKTALQIFENGNLLEVQNLDLIQGDNQFLLPVSPIKIGFYNYRVRIIPELDSRLQNNEASTFVNISGPPNILLVEGTSNEGQNLVSALGSAEMDVTVAAPSQLPSTLLEASNYETIVLINTPVSMIPAGAMEIIKSYVRDLGKGFIMIGGEHSYGAGGYLRSPLEEILPVNMDVRSKELTANLALILAIDKSGSMGRCHCDDPDLNQDYTRQDVGQPKIDIAKEAVMKAASALGPEDYLGVVAFDESAKWALEANKLASTIAIEKAIGGLIAAGQTNISSGIETAYTTLSAIDAKRKHIILLTDGWTQSGDLTPLVEDMASNGITLSIIAAGGGSAEYLEALSETGKGRYYPAEDILQVPDIFLKETVQSIGEYIIEEPFYPLPSSPGPTLYGIDTLTLPYLLGYNGTTPKNAARLDLITPSGDPLLATWQYGLGRTAAWTTDMKGKWAQQWIAWNGFSKFVAQLIGWVVPEPNNDLIEASVTLNNDTGQITLSAVDQFGQPQNFLQAEANIVFPNLDAENIELEQIGSGMYRGEWQAITPGTYLIRIGVNDQDFNTLGHLTLGLAVPYSLEYRLEGIDFAKLSELAQTTGGGQLQSQQDAFIHNLPSTAFAIEIWRPLILIVILLFPFDIAIRRLTLTKRDLQEGIAWISGKLLKSPRKQISEPRVLESLFEAKDRARRLQSLESDPQPKPINKHKETIPDDEPPTSILSDPDQKPDTFARLREAKKRSKKNKSE